MPKQTQKIKLDLLEKWFSSFKSCLVAFSAGVDSSVLALAAFRTLRENAIAVTSVSPSFASEELTEAEKMAEEIGIELILVNQNDLEDENYVANKVSRCYFCRSNLVRALAPIAAERNIEVCVDGTHLDDMLSPRPGVKALREAGFRAPFVELGLSKEDVRSVASYAELSNAFRPSESCLSSRIAFGQKIDQNTLRMVEASERFVKEVTGAKIVRVRTIGSEAIVEVDRPSVKKACAMSKEITLRL
ncbi:MAG TPA: ATP-dependent sacrificial sulfur transferase LarE, partial [Nitrososphaerales archaeon]|nr:ATP-dependent sacrificial sulfur transferase LarE [Nitrososphaerales archaeon]